MLTRRGVGALVYLCAGLLGLLAFFYPLLAPLWAAQSSLAAHHVPLFLAALMSVSFLALLLESQAGTLSPNGGQDARAIALLGVLVAINAVLRFSETILPGPGGFSPVFFLILMTGYVYGARLGFLMGALTMFVSALVTGGMGAWLPHQMFAAGWAGLSAALCAPLVRAWGGEGSRGERTLLAVAGALWGILYGLLMDLWSLTFLMGTATPASFGETLQRYLLLVNASLVWNLLRAGGNAGMILAFGDPVLRILRRFRRRFTFAYRSPEAP